VIVGLGNEWRGDDGVGPEVARRLGGTVLDGEPIGLVALLDGEASVVVVDAVASSAATGTIHRHDASAEPLPTALFGSTSTHALGLAEAIELARSLGVLPARVLVLGIEGESFEFGKGLTPPVAAAADHLVEELTDA
jgi:hydrogenase maturation protease